MKKLFSIISIVLLWSIAEAQQVTRYPTSVIIPRTGNVRITGAVPKTITNPGFAGLLDAVDKAFIDSIRLNPGSGGSLDTTGVLSKINKIEPINGLTKLRAVVANDTTFYQLNYNGTVGNWYYDAADVSSTDNVGLTIVTTGGKRMKRYLGDYINVKWFGAKGDNATNDQPAIQNAINAITHSTVLPFKLYFPPGTYRCSSPLICANFDGNRYYQTTILLSGDPGNTRLALQPTKIYFNFKDSFGIGFQLCKSGGIEGLALESNWTAPTMADSTFYSCDVTEYVDPDARNTRFDPQTLVAVDFARYGGVPATGGYPGLSAYYNAPGQPASNSGSTGLRFYDLQLTQANIGIIFSPNGTTQNAEDCLVSDIFAVNVSKLFISCQSEEKSNIFQNIMAWGGVHTVISNMYGYGSLSQAGHIFVDNVQTAGRVNTMIMWSVGGSFPSFFNRLYSETMGKFGTIAGGAGVHTSVTNSYLGQGVLSEFGGKMPAYFINANADTKFDNCTIRMYGTGVPIVIEGSPIFTNCGFETMPYTSPEFAYSSAGGPQFINCGVSSYSTLKFFGKTGTLYGSYNQFHGYSSYGNYKLSFQSEERYGKYYGFTVNGDRIKDYFVSDPQSITITAGRTFTLSKSGLSLNYRYYLNQAIAIGDYTNAQFAGIVTDTTGANITVSYAPRGINSGSYSFVFAYPRKLYGFFGNTTSGSAAITNCIYDDLSLAVGDVFYSNVFGGLVAVRSIVGTTVTVGSNALSSVTGNYFRDESVVREVMAKNINPSTYLPDNSLFKKGDRILYYSSDSLQVKTCFKSGVYNATGGETRQALFNTD